MRSRTRHEAWLNELACPVIRIEGAHPTDEIAKRVMAALAV